MTPIEGTYFKHIPVHFYQSGSTVMTQTLIKPVLSDGSLMNFGDLMKLTYPLLENGKFIYCKLTLIHVNLKINQKLENKSN